MTQKPGDGFDPSDPLGAWRALRDANLDAWAKSMAQFTNSDAFAKTIGLQLDTMLAASAPVRDAVQQSMEAYLAQANMPSRAEVVGLAQRLTNIELRLDDMQAQLDAILAALRDRPAALTPVDPAPADPTPGPQAAGRSRARKPATDA